MLNWVELSAAAIESNLATFRARFTAAGRVGAVVKSNAYGHGMLEVARIATRAGAEWLCVNSLEEGVQLREAGLSNPILLLGYVPRHELESIVRFDLRPMVYDEVVLDELALLAKQGSCPVRVHLKVETGMNRQGVDRQQALALAERIQQAPGLILEGLGTHFANVDDTTDPAYAAGQVERYESILASMRQAGHQVPVRHIACSAAALLLDHTHLDLVRAGISLYGLWSSRETFLSSSRSGRPRYELQPVLTWKTRVAQVKAVQQSSFVGYGCTYRTTRPSRIAVLPVGYHEGYDRGLSNLAHVLVRGRRAAVCGRVCMNMCMVDVTDIPGVEVEDEVVLLGQQGDERISAEQIAAWAGTINYEVVTRIHPGLPRVVR